MNWAQTVYLPIQFYENCRKFNYLSLLINCIWHVNSNVIAEEQSKSSYEAIY